MRRTSWVLLYLYPTFNLWKKRVFGTKFRIRAWFSLIKTLPKSEFYLFSWPTKYSPLLPGHARPGAALAPPCAAPTRLCATPARAARLWWRAATATPWLRLGVQERERESWVGGERELRENLGFQLGEKAVSFFFYKERRNSPLRSQRKGRLFCIEAPNNPSHYKDILPTNLATWPRLGSKWS